MGMKYVYCVVRGAGDCHGFPPGVEGMPIHSIRVGEIGALLSDAHPGGDRRGVENALAHHGVVSYALACFPAVLPCRFGTVMRDAVEVVGVLQERYPRLEDFLDRFQGKVEVGIKALLEEGGLEARAPAGGHLQEGGPAGARYMCEKSARLYTATRLVAEAERLVHTLHEATFPFVEALRSERKPCEQGVMLSVCCLLERTKLAPFRQRYEGWRRDYPQVCFLYTGPWPPYTFADMDVV